MSSLARKYSRNTFVPRTMVPGTNYNLLYACEKQDLLGRPEEFTYRVWVNLSPLHIPPSLTSYVSQQIGIKETNFSGSSPCTECYKLPTGVRGELTSLYFVLKLGRMREMCQKVFMQCRIEERKGIPNRYLPYLQFLKQ